MSQKVFIVDDEKAITDQLAPLLRRAGFKVAVAYDGQDALMRMTTEKPHLMVLDVMMPRMDGRQLLRTLRQRGDWTPIILLTQVGESSERAMALMEGADDYLNKPFDPFELVARIQAVLRRAKPNQRPLATANQLTAHDLSFERHSRRAFLAKEELNLTSKALALLEYFLLHPDELLSRDRLLDAVWGWDYPVGRRAVDTRIAELRRQLRDNSNNPRYIETVAGQGYRWIAPVEIAS